MTLHNLNFFSIINLTQHCNILHRHDLNFLGNPHGGGNMIELTDLRRIFVYLSIPVEAITYIEHKSNPIWYGFGLK
jgi:hypothetical protein